MKGFVGDVMKRWDELIEAYDLVRIRSFLGGRVRIGYPPSVSAVDVSYPRNVSLLTDLDLIGLVKAKNGAVWSFSIRWVNPKKVYGLPCKERVLLGDWLIDLNQPRKILEPPVIPLQGVTNDELNKKLIAYDHHQVACFGVDGLKWLRAGVLDGNLQSVVASSEGLICSAYAGWISDKDPVKLVLSNETGDVIGGDEGIAALGGELQSIRRS